MTDMPNIYHVSFTFPHHGVKSGYEKISDYLPQAARISSRIFQRTMKSQHEISSLADKVRDRFIKLFPVIEMKAISKMLFDRAGIFHFLYAENSYKFSGILKNPKTRIICSFHQPPDRLMKRKVEQQFAVQRRSYREIDLAIILGESQREIITELIGHDNVHLIPHGIDTDYFGKRPGIESKNKILTVGNWLRDFDMLKRVAVLVGASSPEVQFTIVTLEEHRSRFDGLKNVRFISGITDEELIREYHSTNILFLPLLDCVANNALLEGMSCGLPVIATDIGSVRNYSGEDNSMLIPDAEPEDFANALLNLLSDRHLQESMGGKSREYALSHDWRVIADRMLHLYQSLT